MDSNEKPAAPAPATEVPATSNNQAPNKKSSGSKLMKWILIGAGGFGALLVALIVFVFVYTRGAQEAATQVIGDIRAGNCAVIYTDQTTTYFQSLGAQELWEAECERIGDILTGDVNQEGVSVEGESGENSTSVVSYEIQGSDDITYDVTIGLEKVDGEWKMDTFNSSPQTNAEQAN